ncbi:MAG: helix-turn-helix transcriptional regulator [Acidobacteriaceae bacterium]
MTLFDKLFDHKKKPRVRALNEGPLLREEAPSDPASVVDSPWLTSAQTAAYMRISRKTLFRLLAQKKMPQPAKVGKQFLWRISQLDTYLLEGGSASPSLKRRGRPRAPQEPGQC